jgi:hypothetical protein
MENTKYTLKASTLYCHILVEIGTPNTSFFFEIGTPNTSSTMHKFFILLKVFHRRTSLYMDVGSCIVSHYWK